MKVIVIGKGMIGSAAARHCALAGHDVTLIGPAEPVDKPRHRGAFASHYDEGRIARALDTSTFWTRVKSASMARFDALESQSGITFFHRCGAMMVGPVDGALIAKAGHVHDQMDFPAERLDATQLAARFPDLHFGAGACGFFEPNAGWINPRRLLAAQCAIGQSLGVRIVAAEVTAIRESASGVTVETAQDQFAADQVIIAAGPYVNQVLGRVLGRSLPLQVYARTVLFWEVDAAQAAALAAMPCVVMERASREPYFLPPIRYPDGRWYLKIGGDPDDVEISGAAIGDWFRSDGSDAVAAQLDALLSTLLPGVAAQSRHHAACAVTFTPQDRPLIDRLGPRMVVASAGCARGAKASDELGRMAKAALSGEVDPDCTLAAAMG